MERRQGEPTLDNRHITRKENTAPQTYTGVIATVAIYSDRVAVARQPVTMSDAKRGSESQRRHEQPRQQQGGGIRGKVQTFSARSRRNFIHEARGIMGLCWEITLTYPDTFPMGATGGDMVRRHWDGFRRWLVKQGIGGVSMQEFQGRGAPHRHILLNRPIDIDAARIRWHQIVGTNDPQHRERGIIGGPLRKHPHAAIHYLAKPEQKTPPDNYGNVGRFWSIFGPVEKHGVERIVGTIEQVAPLIRIVRRLERDARRARGQRVRTDRGLYGFTCYSPETLAALAKRLPDLLPLFGLQNRITLPPTKTGTHTCSSEENKEGNVVQGYPTAVNTPSAAILSLSSPAFEGES